MAFLWQALSVNLEGSGLARVTSKQAPGIYLFPHAALASHRNAALPSFFVNAEDPNSGPFPTDQAIPLGLGHLKGLIFGFFKGLFYYCMGLA